MSFARLWKMQVFLTAILIFLVKDVATDNFVLLHCAHDRDAIDRVSIEKQAGSDTYLLQADCKGTNNVTDPVEIQSTDLNCPSVDEKIVLSCEEGDCFKETIPLEDILLWHNRTDRTCEGEEETSKLASGVVRVKVTDFSGD